MLLIGTIYNKKELGMGEDVPQWLSEAIERRGISALSQVRGSYVAVLEGAEKTILIRDSFGTIPLYYYSRRVDGKVLYGTGVKDLLRAGVPRKISSRGLFAYLAYGCVYAPYTIVDGVFTVPPGSVVIFDHDKVVVKRYWSPSFDIRSWNREELQNRLSVELRRAIGEQVADGNVAAFLSGGIDSSSIVSLWRQQYNGEIRTYCVTHEDDRTDERRWARIVAEKNHTRHTELALEDRLIREWLSDAVAAYDQPSIDGLNFWFATRLAKEAGESVMLSGEGGDELFMGYWKFIKHQLAYKYAPIARMLPRCIGSVIDRLSPREKFRKLAMLIGFKGEPYYIPRRIMSDWQISSFVSKDILHDCGHLESIGLTDYSPYPDDLLNRISWLEMETVVPDMWMRDGYQTSASNDISIRTPLCDTRVAELLYTVPGEMKCSGGISKPLLVDAAGEGLPISCVKRSKQGFSLPFDRYFSGVVKDRIDDFLEGRNLLIFNREAVREIGKRYRMGKVYWSRVWVLFMCENWCRENKIEI